MRQKKVSGDGKNMAENKNKSIILMFLAEIGCMLLVSLGIYLLEYTEVLKQGTDYMLAHIVFFVLGIAVIGFCLRQDMLRGELDYDNNEHPGRFWLSFMIGLPVAFACAFLPVSAWPFMPVYVLLGLFGSLHLGVLGATVLLALPVCLAGAEITVFLMYLISGAFSAVLFKSMQNEDGFRTGVPFVFSMGGLLVCETAGTVLVKNAKPEPEFFVLPAVNLLVSGVLLFGILKLFSEKVIYPHRESYLDLIDTENSILTVLKQENRAVYMKSIHTAHFCERIAGELGMNVDSVKCASYYYGMGDQLPELFAAYPFPPEAVMILEEYQDKGSPVRHRETAVLVITEKIISTVLQLQAQAAGGSVDYDKAIEEIFERFREEGTFVHCDVSMRDMEVMRKIFKGEKLYYDFLR